MSPPCFPPCTLEAEGAFFRTLKRLLKVPLAAAQQWLVRGGGQWFSQIGVLGPGQGLGLMASTKLPHPPPFRKRGSQHHSLSFCSDLEGGGVGLPSGMDRVAVERAGGRRRWGGALPAEGRIRSLAQ